MAEPTGSSGSGRGRRELRVRVKTAKGRKISSTRWLERQLNDPYVARARAEGYRGRAAYKLIEIDDRYRFLRPGARVVDLGAAPGGWTEVAVARVNAAGQAPGKPRGRVLAIDLQEVEPVAGAEIHLLDFLSEDADGARPARGTRTGCPSGTRSCSARSASRRWPAWAPP
jgi:23S rRNA (uridine2552-2'-O)-methyltransferase